MKRLALGLIFAALSAGAFAQNTESVGGTSNAVAGGSAAGAGETAGAGALLTANTVMITAGALAAGAVVAGSKTETTTSH